MSAAARWLKPWSIRKRKATGSSRVAAAATISASKASSARSRYGRRKGKSPASGVRRFSGEESDMTISTQ